MENEHPNARSVRTGRDFEDFCESYLTLTGWTVLESKGERHGIEIDIIAEDRSGRERWIECKGGYRGAGRDGAARTDNVLKFLGALRVLDWVAPDHPPYELMASALPSSGRAARWLEQAEANGVRVHVLPMIEEDA